MSVKPFQFQKDNINEIWTKFKNNDRILYQLPTGGGKTFVFSFLVKHWCKTHANTPKQRVLILCHRTELIEQTIASLNRIGVTCESVVAGKNKYSHNSDAYVAMIETANNRLKKNPYFFKNVGLVIADECHILIFNKVFDYFKPPVKILGCSATPVVMKRVKFWRCKLCKNEYKEPTECCNHEADEWSRPFTLSQIYDDIVVGPGIDELINMNPPRLVRELSFVENYVNQDNLKTDSDGEFTTESLDNEYGSDGAAFNVLLNYEKLCKGKKTMIFNPSARVNLIMYHKFKDAGLNVRMFDSINDTEHSRQEVIEWFKSPENRDAILMNVGVFTTGFDVTDVEAIILNRATGSLSLFLQIVGRGGRVTDVIYKENFVLIDGGGNIDRFQEWSDPTRDWHKLFTQGNGKEKIKKEDVFDVEVCESCGLMYKKSEPDCPECGHKITPPPPKPQKEEKESSKVLMPIREIPPPNGEKIYKYTLSQSGDTNFAFKIMISQIVDMFKFYRVTADAYVRSKNKGEAEKKIKRMIQKCYFTIISKKDIQASNNRTINYLVEKTISKLDQYYSI